jgi:hypothetical protein
MRGKKSGRLKAGSLDVNKQCWPKKIDPQKKIVEKEKLLKFCIERK